MYWDLSTCHDWPVKKAIVDLPIRMKEIQNAPPVIPLLGADNKDLGAASQTLLTEVKLLL